MMTVCESVTGKVESLLSQDSIKIGISGFVEPFEIPLETVRLFFFFYIPEVGYREHFKFSPYFPDLKFVNIRNIHHQKWRRKFVISFQADSFIEGSCSAAYFSYWRNTDYFANFNFLQVITRVELKKNTDVIPTEKSFTDLPYWVYIISVLAGILLLLIIGLVFRYVSLISGRCHLKISDSYYYSI